MNVLLTGATGYLGSAVLAALLADGHTVRAHLRSTASEQRPPDGAEPVRGELTDPAWLRGQLKDVDGIVHAASPNDATSGAFEAAFLDAALPALAGSGRPLVVTAGNWIHGSGTAITEDTPPDPPAIVAWRPAVVQRVRAAAADAIRTVVISPANLYGDGGGIPALLRDGPVTDGPEPALRCVGGDQHFANVHRDDIAALYALALREAPAGSYYLGADRASPTMAEVTTAASRLRGLDGRIAPESQADSRKRLGPLADALLLDAQIDAGHAHALGWRPSGPSLIEELTTGSYTH